MLDKLEIRKEPGIYIFTNKIDGKVYVGESMNVSKRIKEHVRQKDDYVFHRALRKHGFASFQIEIEYFPNFSKTDLLNLEEALIKRFGCIAPNGYNICNRGQNRVGLKHSEETRKKISNATRGENNPNYGKKMSMEQRKKISNARKQLLLIGENSYLYGKKHKKETCDKISASQTGKKASIETRQRLSESHKGENHHFYGKKFSDVHINKIRNSQKKMSVIQYSKSGEKISDFDSTREAARSIGMANGSGNISKCCNLKCPSAYGFIWRYGD